MKVYLSGPMTGLPENNYPAFHEAAARLRDAGHEVYDPSEWTETYSPDGMFHLGLAFKDYCAWIIDEADVVAVLPDWGRSLGATAEVALARAIGKKWYTVDEVINGGPVE